MHTQRGSASHVMTVSLLGTCADCNRGMAWHYQMPTIEVESGVGITTLKMSSCRNVARLLRTFSRWI